jgi:transcriptional regulator with XRE-family HTH domain
MDAGFGLRLRRLMEERGLTQSGLAAAMWGRRVNDEGVLIARNRELISVWVRGSHYPDEEQLGKLAQALGVKVTDLMPGSGDV